MSTELMTTNGDESSRLALSSLTCDQVVYLLLAIGCRQMDLHLRGKNITGEDLCFVDGIEDLLDLGMGLPLIQTRKLFHYLQTWKTSGVDIHLFHALPEAILHRTHQYIEELSNGGGTDDEDAERVLFLQPGSQKDGKTRKRKITEIASNANKTTNKQKKPEATKSKASTTISSKKSSESKALSSSLGRQNAKIDKVLSPHEVYTVTKHIECIRSTNQSSHLEDYAIKKDCITLVLDYMTDVNYRHNLKTVLYALDSLVRLITWNREEAHPQLASYLIKFHAIYGWERLLDLLALHYTSSDFVLKAGQLLRWIHRVSTYQQVFQKKKAQDTCILILKHHCQSDKAETEKKDKGKVANSQQILRMMLKVLLPLANEKITRPCFCGEEFVLSLLNLISQYQPKLSDTSDDIALPMLEEMTTLLLHVVSGGSSSYPTNINKVFLDNGGFLTLISLAEDSLGHEDLLENTMGILFNLSTTDECVDSCLGYRVVDLIIDVADQHVFTSNIFEYTCRLLTNIFAASEVLKEFVTPTEYLNDIRAMTALTVGKKEVTDLLRILFQGCHVYSKNASVLEQVLASLNNMTIDEDIQKIFVEEQQGIDLLRQLISQHLFFCIGNNHTDAAAGNNKNIASELKIFEVLCKIFLNISATKQYQHFFFSATKAINNGNSKSSKDSGNTGICVYEQLWQVLSLGYKLSSALAQAIVSISLNLLIDVNSQAALTISLPYIDALFMALQYHQTQEDFVTDSLTLIGQLLSLQRNQEREITSATLVKQLSLHRKCNTLCEILRKYGDEDSVFEDCFSIMNHLLEHSLSCGNSAEAVSQLPLISKLGGMYLICDRIKHVMSSRICMEEVFACLRMLLQLPENRVHVGMAKNGMDTIAKVWQRYKTEGSVVEEIAAVVRELVTGNAENQEKLLESTVHCDLLLDALERYVAQESIVDCVLKALTYLSKRLDLFEENIVLTTPFPQLMLRLLLQYSPPNTSINANMILVRVNRLLHQLIVLPGFQQKFREEIALTDLKTSNPSLLGQVSQITGLSLLLRITKSYMGSKNTSNMNVLTSLLESLQLFAMEVDSSVALGKEGLCNICVEILDVYVDDTQVLDIVLQVIYNIIQDQVNQQQFLRLRLQEKLLLIRRQLRTEEVQIKEQINEILPFLQSSFSP